MDGVEACPWGLLSLAGALATLVVAPSQCVEASAAGPDDDAGEHRRPRQDGGRGGGGCCSLRGVVAGCRWIEAVLALAAVGLGVGSIVWTATHGGGGGCQWLHLGSRLVASTLLLAPALATLVHRQTAPVKSAWAPYALNGMAMLLAAGAGRLYGERGEAAAWGDRDPGLLLEAGLLGVLALLAVVKAVATLAARAAVAPTTRGGPAVAMEKKGRRRHRRPEVAEDLKAPLLGERHEAEAAAADARSRPDEASAAAPATPAPLDRAGLWSRLTFGWVDPLLRTGAARQLGSDDVPPLAAEDGTARWARRFDAALDAERARAKPSLLRAARVVFGADFYAFAGLQLINDLLGFSGPVLLKLVVTYVQDFAAGTASLARGYAILLVLLLTYTTTAALSTQYNLRMARLQLRVRTALVAAVYAQVLRCRAPQLGGLGSGEVTNLISLDVQRLQDAASSFNSFWSLPVQVALTLYLLYREVSYAFVAGLAIFALIVPLNMAIANAITRITQRQMRFKDQRVQTCDEMLHGIRTLKMLAWEDHLAAALHRLRREEVACLARRKYLDALCVIFWASIPVLTALATFAAVAYIDRAIDPAAVFTTIALLQMLTFPLNAFPWILNGLMEARVSKRRLQRFLLDMPAPPNYVIRAGADDGPTPTMTPSPGAGARTDSPKKKPRRTPTIEGIFRNTAAAAGASTGGATGGSGAGAGAGSASYCLEIFGSFAWEEPPLPPPPLPPTLEGRGEEEEDGDHDAAGLGLLASPALPERVVGVEELQEAEGLIPPADAASGGGGGSSGGVVEDETKGQDRLAEEVHLPQHQLQQQRPKRRGFLVQDLALRVRKGEVVGVYGRIGAGKSSLLAAVLGEMHAVVPPSSSSGAASSASPSRVVLRARRVAYVAQSPWLQRGSVRDNIVFGAPWDPPRFAAVVAACGLDEDLAALPGGAGTEVGERGGTLSGGQRQRVALARALYSRAELYLLDDPFSGLDGRTAAHVARAAVQGMMRREGATVVLVTHALPLLAACDWAVAMRGGRVVERVRVRQPQQQPHQQTPVAAALSHAATQESGSAATEMVAATASRPSGGKGEEEGPAEADKTTTKSEAATAALATEETREEGKVRWRVYRYYVVSAGRLLSLCTVASLLAMQLSANAMSLWLSAWSAHTDRYTPSQFLAVSGAIAGANTGFTVLRSFLFAWGGLRAARRLHDRLLASVLHTAMAFFEANPVGRILNRFAGDTWTVDDSLPFILNILLAQSAALVGTTVVLALASPWTLLVLLLVSPLYHRLQAFYRASSRELKRLDSVARSPLLAHFSETMAGAVTVRAFGAAPRFRRQSLALVDANQRVAFYSSAASQWLGLRIQAFGVLVVASVAAWAVGSCAAHRPARAELIGLALSYASGVLGNLGGLLNAYAETEREMVAVERVHEFTAQPPERAVAAPPAVEVAADWPWAGAIRVEGLCLRYRTGWPRALDRVSLRVAAGEKLAVCGRTGSGKSSLLACLFRLVAWEEGAILVDGAPLDRVPLRRLRAALAIIPQEPVLFRGTVRSNLDPAGEYDDAALFSALQACQLDAVLREHHAHQHHAGAGAGAKASSTAPSLAECLEMDVQEKGANFSVGQRQLLCLCRVLLRRARVVCVDEATASLDAATDAQVRRTLAGAFRDATVVMIAHRMSTVLELCTRAVVLSEGRVVEEGDPRQLLLDPASHLYALSKAESGRRDEAAPEVQ